MFLVVDPHQGIDGHRTEQDEQRQHAIVQSDLAGLHHGQPAKERDHHTDGHQPLAPERQAAAEKIQATAH
ncbi:hypothetical protein D3C84_1128920 [compost metagenome]